MIKFFMRERVQRVPVCRQAGLPAEGMAGRVVPSIRDSKFFN
jgi:hypothetical protein